MQNFEEQCMVRIYLVLIKPKKYSEQAHVIVIVQFSTIEHISYIVYHIYGAVSIALWSIQDNISVPVERLEVRIVL